VERKGVSPKEANTFLEYAIRDEYITLTDPAVQWSEEHDLVSFDMKCHRVVFKNKRGSIDGIHSIATLDGERVTYSFLGKDLMEYLGSLDLHKLQKLLENAT
jgi:hypothetical protein